MHREKVYNDLMVHVSRLYRFIFFENQFFVSQVDKCLVDARLRL
jgi:hypothetical protein